MAVNSIDSVMASYTQITEGAGTPGYEGGVEISYENDILTFNEADGDSYTVNAAGLKDSDIETLAAQLGGTVKGAEATETTATSDDLDANKAKMEELEGQWGDLKSAADTIKETVEKLSDEIKKELDEAIKEQKEITKDEQERIQELVADQITQFKKDKENGKDVKLSDLQGNIKDGISQGGFDEDMASIISGLVGTNAKMVQMDLLLSELGVLNSQMKVLDSEMTSLADTIEQQEAEAAAAASCDPIGFENEDGTKFEFVIDKDGNGELSNFSEFLGSENFFDEMIALDADKSGDVSTEELNAAGVKVLVTEKDGTQSMKSIAEAFGGEDVNVNLNSYKEAADGATASNGQKLLGNFDISVGDDKFEGYSTLDSEDYLLNNYNFSDANPVNAGITTGTDATSAAGEADAEAATERTAYTDDIDQFIEDYSAKLEAFEEQFANVVELLGLDQELIDTIQECAKTAGTAAAKSIISEAEKKEEKEAAEAKEQEEAKEAEETEAAENANNEEADDKDKEEEKEAA